MVNAELAGLPLFEGLEAAALEEIRGQMQPRRFIARSFLCRRGEPGDSLFVIQSGLAEVFVDPLDGATTFPQLHPGDIVGEIALLTGEPRSANVRASVTTDVLELSREAFAAITARHPAILVNLSRILGRRLASPIVQAKQQRRGELVALVIGQRAAPLVAEVIGATRGASPGSVAAVDLTGSLPNDSLRPENRTIEGLLGSLNQLLTTHPRVIVVVSTEQERLALLLEHVDRIVVLASKAEAERPASIVGPVHGAAEIVVLTDSEEAAPGPGGAQGAPRRVGGLWTIRAFDPDSAGPRGTLSREIAWLGRHLSRTKLGLALGAGGAKGYAHIGALQVLQEAGYTVDYVAGSSIGALVGAWLALGMDAAEIEATMRRTFTPETVEILFRGTMSGMSAGGDVMARLWQETTNHRSFSDLAIPLVAMAVDLETSLPSAIAEGPLWEALLAAMAIPGLFPPYERGEQRLVDGVALVPVPTGALIEAGADITVSVNLMSMNREKLAAWPGESPPEPPPTQRNLRTLDALLDVMELTWADSSVRHAALANVVITPRFGPASWRSFQLADRFLAAGRQAATLQLEALGTLAKPLTPGPPQRREASSSPGVASSSRQHGRQTPQEFTLDDVKGILIDLVGLPASEMPDDPEASFAELGLDSIAFLEVQIEMEQRYGLRIPEADAQEIRTLTDAVEYVNRRLHATG